MILADHESNPPSLAELEGAMDEEKNIDDGIVVHPVNSSCGRRRDSLKYQKLSTIARMYDVDGDGELNGAEQKMYEMDKSRRGYLTNDKVYAMMQEHIYTQTQLFRTRRIMFVLLALVAFLALSNLGTSSAAAYLAKDTTTNENEELTHKSNGEALSTQSTEETMNLVRATLDENGRRKLCLMADKCLDTKSFLSMNKGDCRRMKKKCKRGNSVGLRHVWSNGAVSYFNACPFTSGQEDRFGMSHFRNREGKDFSIEQDNDGHCKFQGDALKQRERDYCEQDDDCIDDAIDPLVCAKVNSVVKRCKDICNRRRYAPRLQRECRKMCNHATCQRKSLVQGRN